MICPEYLAAGLEAAFTRIQNERMQDVPILNSALEVQVVGFRSWENYCLGVLITPWFMNLMLLPHEGDEWSEHSIGACLNHVFPSGNYEFILGEEESIGRYQMCSLFSPVFEFEDQAAAVATAEAAIQGLMDEENRDTVSTRASEMQKIWSGEEGMPEDEAIADAEDRPSLKERIQQPISRRDMLRGTFLGTEE